MSTESTTEAGRAATYLDALVVECEQRRKSEQAIELWVGLARSHGATWAQVGDALGISRQAAQQRYGQAER